MEKNIYNQQEVLSAGNDDASLDFSDIVRERVFLSEFPIEAIFDGLKSQFQDYINIEDTNNYVDIFYNAYHMSIDRVMEDTSEEHPQELFDLLDEYYNSFIYLIQELFYNRLTLSIYDIESEDIFDKDILEMVIRKLYEFFIINAKRNFKVVISKDILKAIKNKVYNNDEEFIEDISERVDDYSALITNILPDEFLKYCGDSDICKIFDDQQINGNFLRKYSPKLYQNEDLKIDIINYITILYQFKSNLMEDEKYNE